MTTGWEIVIGLLLIVAAVVGVNSYLGVRDDRAFKAGFASAEAKMQERELEAERRGREQEQAATQAAAKEAQDARTQTNAVTAALGDAERSAERLRDQLALARRTQCRVPSPAPAGGSAPADAAERMQAELYRGYVEATAEIERRLGEAERRVQFFADQAHIAGSTCERTYDQVNK